MLNLLLPVEIEQEVYKHERGKGMRELVSDITNLNKPRRVCHKTEIKNLGRSRYNAYGCEVVEDWNKRPDLLSSLRMTCDLTCDKTDIVFELVVGGYTLMALEYDSNKDHWTAPAHESTTPFLLFLMELNPPIISLRKPRDTFLGAAVTFEYDTMWMSSHEKTLFRGKTVYFSCHETFCTPHPHTLGCQGFYYYTGWQIIGTHILQENCFFSPQPDLVAEFEASLDLSQFQPGNAIYDLQAVGNVDGISLYFDDVHVSDFEQVGSVWKPECGNFASLSTALVNFQSWTLQVRPKTSRVQFRAKCAALRSSGFPGVYVSLFYRPGPKRCYLYYENRHVYMYEFNNTLQQGTV